MRTCWRWTSWWSTSWRTSRSPCSLPLEPGRTIHQPLDELVLPGDCLVLGDRAGLPLAIDLLELLPDAHRVVVLLLGLLEHLVGYRDRAAQRRERQPEQPGEKSHQTVPPTKSYGAMGPVNRRLMRSCTDSASPSRCCSRSSRRSSSTSS